ncbi:npy1p [Saccharomyces arboricola H-6]|uniref:NAD(+) diphosphatase n=1 Tax=Saccharomyces arboricola (strain H-6 / AS 2.3317 / CBS 10644) TaxID=1160507 RepID=J8PNQ5_SACAR|nr:npy1p [Saccharomyces arboricola H-6]
MSIASSFFGQQVLNRVSFLRCSKEFVKKSLNHDSTIIIPFIEGEALISPEEGNLVQLSRSTKLYKNIISTIVPVYTTLLNTTQSRIDESGVNLTFLGLLENTDSTFDFEWSNISYKGTPYFGLDIRVTDKTLFKHHDFEPIFSFPKMTRDHIFKQTNADASLYAQGRMYLDWLAKYKFCPGCGSKLFPVDAGTKLQCSNENKSVHCNVRDAHVNNVCFPRTDPSVIIAMTNSDYSKCCLARSKKRYGDFVLYSTIAGFMEPSETIEEACVREIWEETGISCKNVNIVRSQPWPYPCSLMIGCLGIVEFNCKNEVINLNHDDELLDAQWFDTTEIIRALDNYTDGIRVPFRKDISLPGSTTIAFQLIKNVCENYKKLRTASSSHL